LFHETNITKKLNKSINKKACENYLFEDYHFKSGMEIWILALMTSGSNTRDAVEISSLRDGPIACQNGSPVERLRYEKQTFPPDPFRLLWVEMLYSGG
jgi:hypothetical protein